jgi:hypothetical protein
MNRAARVVLSGLLGLTVASPGAFAADSEGLLAEVDAAWARRAEGASGGTAREGSVEPVVAAGRRAVAERPESLEARWRLMRALYFQGEHATTGDEAT